MIQLVKLLTFELLVRFSNFKKAKWSEFCQKSNYLPRTLIFCPPPSVDFIQARTGGGTLFLFGKKNY